jgi:hypothetical protein
MAELGYGSPAPARQQTFTYGSPAPGRAQPQPYASAPAAQPQYFATKAWSSEPPAAPPKPDRGRATKVLASVIGFVVAGAVSFAISHHASEPPKDEFGYTTANRQAFVAGCGGGERCDCMFDALERAITPDRFLEVSQDYMRTGAMAPDVLQIIVTSGC